MPPTALLNVAAKAALAALIAYYLARPELPQFAGKAMPFRASLYPLVALLLPALWRLRGRGRPYPHLADALLVLPMVLDTAGNSVGLYGDFDWFGPVVHFATLAAFVSAFGLLLADRGLGPVVTPVLVLGIGSTLHVIWELLEYGGVELIGVRLDISYLTTIRNFMAALAGGVVGALVTAAVVRARARDPRG